MTHSIRGWSRLPLVALLVASAACNTDSPLSPGNSCSVALSGSVNSTTNCNIAAAAAYVAGTNQSTVAFGFGTGTTTNAASVAIRFTGAPSSGSYSSTASGASGNIIATTPAGAIWTASAGTGSATVGSYTLHITSATQVASSSITASYIVHGTLVATLIPQALTGASGNLTFNASF